jgi:hypothetical protein
MTLLLKEKFNVYIFRHRAQQIRSSETEPTLILWLFNNTFSNGKMIVNDEYEMTWKQVAMTSGVIIFLFHIESISLFISECSIVYHLNNDVQLELNQQSEFYNNSVSECKLQLC